MEFEFTMSNEHVGQSTSRTDGEETPPPSSASDTNTMPDTTTPAADTTSVAQTTENNETIPNVAEREPIEWFSHEPFHGNNVSLGYRRRFSSRIFDSRNLTSARITQFWRERIQRTGTSTRRSTRRLTSRVTTYDECVLYLASVRNEIARNSQRPIISRSTDLQGTSLGGIIPHHRSTTTENVLLPQPRNFENSLVDPISNAHNAHNAHSKDSKTLQEGRFSATENSTNSELQQGQSSFSTHANETQNQENSGNINQMIQQVGSDTLGQQRHRFPSRPLRRFRHRVMPNLKLEGRHDVSAFTGNQEETGNTLNTINSNSIPTGVEPNVRPRKTRRGSTQSKQNAKEPKDNTTADPGFLKKMSENPEEERFDDTSSTDVDIYTSDTEPDSEDDYYAHGSGCY